MPLKASALVCAMLAAIPAARADEVRASEQVPPKARVLADLGRAFHDAGEYSRAIAAFKEAYVLAPSPALLFDLAQAYRLSGDCDDAVWMYRRYLASDPDPEGRAAAQAHLARVEKCAHRGGPVVADWAVAALDAPAPAPAAPRHAAPPVAAVIVAPPSPGPSRARQASLWVGLGGAIALTGAGYFALDAHAASNEVSAAYAHPGNGANIGQLDARGRRSAELATVLGAGGGLAIAGAAALYFLGGRAAPARHVAVAPKPGGAEVSVSWPF